MNWFGRYGIPGAYFVGLMVIWIYAIRPDLFKNAACPSPELLAASAAVTFLPLGYIISIFGQFVYLNWRRCFIGFRRLGGWLGFHGAAMDRLGFQLIQDEAIIEARTLLLTASRDGPLSVDTHRYIRNWIARRMDVVAINLSVIVATVLAGIIALIFFHWFPSSFAQAIPLLISSALVMAVMVCSIVVLRRQVIEVITRIYREWGRP